MSPLPQTSTSSYKALALFTPGGDLVYCLDPDKKRHWHVDLCVALQELLDLPEPPHFLTPGYTATLDWGYSSKHNTSQVFAETYPATFRYRHLLNAVFQVSGVIWHRLPHQDQLCDPLVLSSYRKQFPQLWQNHDLIVRLDQVFGFSARRAQAEPRQSTPEPELPHQGYVFRLFVAGHGARTEQILKQLHQMLEEQLQEPYTLKVIDVLKHPEEAEANQVTAIPTLVRVWPKPIHRLVGEFDQSEQLIHLLDCPVSEILD
jgi:circadian clock protein KaiB